MAADTIASTNADTPKQIAFIDTSVSDYQTLARHVQPGVEVVLIDGAQDGLAQIAAALAGRSGLEAVHLFSHGAAGLLQVGSTRLTLANMDQHAAGLTAIRDALGERGDLLIYGCDVAQGAAGAAFVDALAQATGADVAASSDATGSMVLGGDWVLEAHSGTVDAPISLNQAGMSAYGATLAIGDAHFDNGSMEYQLASAWTFGDWKFTSNLATDMAVAGKDPATEFPVYLNSDGTGTDRAVLLNFNVYPGVTSFTMSADDGTNFKLESFKIGQSDGAERHLSISAWSNGVQVVADENVNLGSSDSAGNISYSVIANDSFGRYGTLTFNSLYGNIDEIRFSFLGTADLHIDDIDVSTAVLPDTTAPVFASAAVNGSSLVLTYTDTNNLDAANPPAAGAFAVTVGGSSVTVNSVSVDGAAKTVTLTLASNVQHGQSVTVAYTDPTAGNDTNAIQDAAGNDAASLGATAVTNNTPDTTAPAFASAAVNGNSLVMSYTDASNLSTANPPAAGAFAVMVGGSLVAVSGVSVAGAAKTITLTLASNVQHGQSVTVAYTDPTAGNDLNAIQDAAGNDAASLGATAVTNNTPDTTGPSFASAAVNGGTLVMTYTDTSNLDAANPPAAGAFTVMAGGSAVAVNSVSVNGAAKTITLTLASNVQNGQAVTVAYTDPTAGNDANAIQDTAGNDAASLAATAVTNNTPDTTAPEVSGIAGPANGSYRTGQALSFTITFDENVTVTGTTSSMGLNIGSTARTAIYASKTANSITYTYIVQAGDNDADGIAITGYSLNGSTIRDAAGNSALLSLAGHLPSTAAVLVDTTAPAVSGNIAVPANATYVLGQHLDFTISFDENVTVTGGDSTLGLTIGSTPRSAIFLSSSGNTVTYRYTVQAGDLDANGITVGSLTPGASTIRDAAGNNASLSLAGHVPATSGVLIDARAPSVAGVAAPSNATYVAGQHLDFTVTFDENVTVTGGDSTLGLIIGSTAKSASFLSSSGNTVNYRYTVQAGDLDANGITVNGLALGASTIRDATGNNASLSLTGHLPSTAGVLVDALAPAVSGNLTAPSNGRYVAGHHLDFTVTFDEAVTVTGTGSTLGLSIGTDARSASFLSSSGNTVTYRYTVQAGDLDADGIAIGALALGGSTIRDAAGNNANLSLTGHLPVTTGVLVDAVAPSVSGNVTVPSNGSYVAGQTLSFTVSFDENVTVTGTDSSLGLTIGATARTAVYASKTANSITYTYTVQAGDNDADGIAIGGLALGLSTIRDAASNNANVSLLGHLPSTAAVLVDTIAPGVSGNIVVPANATYVLGQHLDFTISFDENVTVTGTDSALGLTIGSSARSASFLSSSGNTVTYRYTVQAGDLDANGITVGSLTLGASTIRDAAGNNASLSLAGHVPATSGVLIDAQAPGVAGVAAPSNATYVAGQHLDFTVTFDENVTVTGGDSTLGLTIGSTAQSASFLSSSGNTVTYRYTVQAGDLDANGITVGSLALGASTIRDATGNDANLSLTGHLPSTAGVLVDALAPAVSGNLTAPSNGSYVAGQTLSFTVSFDENVTVTGTDSTLGLSIGSTAHNASFASKTANSITYTYTVQAGDLDADGITVGSLVLGTSTIRDAAGNDANLTLTGHLPSTSAVLVDAIAPAVSGNVTAPANATYVAGQTLSFTVSFDENVTVTGTDSTLGLSIGSSVRSASFASKTANSITYTYTVQAGDLDADGIAIGSLALGTSTIRDAAGNNANLSLAGHLPSTSGVLVDTSVPSVAGMIGVPAGATYVLGQHLDFTITFDENVTVTGSDSALALSIGAAARSAGFLSSSGNTVTYRYTVQAGDLDADGVTVGALALGTSTIRDAAGNNASVSLGGHLPSTAAVLVDAIAPSVASVAAPSNAAYVTGQHLDFTVSFDENVSVTGSDSTLGLTIGASARSASFLSSSGNTVTYRYTVQAGDNDADGIAIGSLALGTSTIVDAAGNHAGLSLAGHLPATGGVLVDTLAPAVSGTIGAPAGAAYVVGQVLSFTIGFDENLTVTGVDSTLGLTIGSTARSATYASKTANSITYTYTVQAGDNDADGIAVGSLALGTSTIVDGAGNNANLSLAGHLPSTAAILVDTIAPAFMDAKVNGATLVMRYTEATLLDAVHAPSAGAFSVLVGGTAIAVTAVAVDAATHTLTLTLASAVTSGQAVTVAYADPTAGNDADALQDAAGNDAASLAATTVLNTTAAPVATRPVTVDGVVLQVGSRVNSDGSVSQVLTIPVVTASREEQIGNNTVADIPLVTLANGSSILNAQVPTGYGMTASGPDAPGTAADSLTDLIREIQAHTAPGSQDQNQLTGGGTGFLAELAPATPLQVLTIAPTMDGGSAAPTQSLVVKGTPAAAGNPYTALVLDTRALPANATIELHDVEFAAIIGAARVTGGTGAQHVWGDSSAQDIFLGEGDDILHGGGGNDIVGSAGGNDQIFGDDGDDLVFGGLGNDLIDGGAGQDVLLLAGANRADYSLRVAEGKLVMLHLHGGSDGLDMVANVETLRFSHAAADTSVYGSVNRLVEAYTGAAAALTLVDAMVSAAQKGATLPQIAHSLYAMTGAANAGLNDGAYIQSLYRNVFHRDADSGGIAFRSGKLAAGMGRADVALALANSAEKLAMPPADVDFNASDVATLVRMYSALFDRKADAAGLNYWIGAHEAGKSMADIADAFVSGAELSGRYGNMSNAQFIDALYQSALHRQASSAEAGFWVGKLDNGQLDRGDVLLGFANSAEKIALIGTITTSIDTF